MRYPHRLLQLSLAALAALSCGGNEPTPPEPPAAKQVTLVVQAELPDLPVYPKLGTAVIRVLAADGPTPGAQLLAEDYPLAGATRPLPAISRSLTPGTTGATRAVLEVELRALNDPARAEWAARSDTFALREGVTLPIPLRFGRGPLAWLGSTVRFVGDGPLALEAPYTQPFTLVADPGVRPYLYMLDPGVAVLMNDSVTVAARAPGTTALVAMAGLRADTLTIVVQPPPTSLSVSPAEVEVASIGDTVAFTVTARDAQGNALSLGAVAWESSDSRVVARIDGGRAVSNGNGEATISVRSLTNPAARATVHWVTRQQVARVLMVPDSATFPGLFKAPLLAAAPLDARGNLVSAIPEWRVTAPAYLVPLANASPLHRFLSSGGLALDATVTVTAGGKEAVGHYRIVPADTGLSIEGFRTLGAIGASTRLTAMATNELGARHAIPVRWSSSAPEIVSVGDDGTITARGPGSAVVTASSESPRLTAQATITVKLFPSAIAWVERDPLDIPPSIMNYHVMKVVVRDALGAPVPGATVRWSASGGHVMNPSSASDAAGVAESYWGSPYEGVFTVTAAIDGSSVQTTRTIKLLRTVVSFLMPVTPAADSTRSGAVLPRQPVLQAYDLYQEPLARAGIPISARVAGGIATLSGTTMANTDAQGVVRFTDLAISGPPGTYVLEFRAPDTWMVLEQKVVIVP